MNQFLIGLWEGTTHSLTSQQMDYIEHRIRSPNIQSVMPISYFHFHDFQWPHLGTLQRLVYNHTKQRKPCVNMQMKCFAPVIQRDFCVLRKYSRWSLEAPFTGMMVEASTVAMP